MAKRKIAAGRLRRELDREVDAIVEKVAELKGVKDASAYKKLRAVEEHFDLYGVGFSTEHRDEIIAKAALAGFLLAVARYFDVPPETVIQVKRAGW